MERVPTSMVNLCRHSQDIVLARRLGCFLISHRRKISSVVFLSFLRDLLQKLGQLGLEQFLLST